MTAAADPRAAWREAALSARRDRLLDELRRAGGEPISIGVFSATTWRPLAPFIEGELLLEGLRPEIRFFEHGALEGEIAGGAARFDAAVLALDDPAAWSSLHDPHVRFGEEEAAELAGRLLSRVDRLAVRAGRTLAALPPAPPRLPHPLDRTPEGDTLGARAGAFSVRIERGLLGRPGVEAVSIEAATGHLGANARDPRLWELGRIRYSEAGFLAIARALAPRLLLQAGKGIKAVVVDLDNTLWGGIAGEEGLSGIRLGGEFPGSAYRAFQEELLRWKRAGILLAAASKNNPGEALEVLDRHPEMVLRSGDFDRLEIHWEPKVRSLRRILAAFNLAPDAVLYLDDSPQERAAAAREFPSLRLLDLPEEPLHRVDALRAIPWPLFTDARGEAHRRPALQAQGAARRAAEAQAGSREEYLESLAIEVRFSRDEPADAPRIAQLHQKTNQFNLDPRRLGERQVLEAMEDPERIVLALRYRDGFGDAGLTAAAVARLERSTLVVETFLLSCRIIGLGVERALLAGLLAEAPAEVEAIRLPFRPTERNAPAREFIESLGGLPEGARELLLPRPRLPGSPPWIRLGHREPKPVPETVPEPALEPARAS